MSLVVPWTDRWAVSTRTHGEVLTTEAVVPGLDVRVLGLPEGFTRDEVESWITSLAAASREGAVAAAPDDPIPPVLRHVLGGLLFSHAELWGQSPVAPCSVVLVHEHGRVAFGWIGDASVQIYQDGRELTPEWVSVRDHQGREARAWCGDGHQDVRVEMVWSSGSRPDEAVRLEAHWAGAGVEGAVTAVNVESAPRDDAPTDTIAVEPPVDPGSAEFVAETAAVEPAMEPSPAEAPGVPADTSLPWPDLSPADVMPLDQEAHPTPRPSSGVARWLAQRFGWGREKAAARTATAAEDAGVQEPPATPGPVVSIQETSAPVDPLASSTFEVVPLPLDVPGQIPPTPEPRSLTALAVRETFEIEDPRVISLPEGARRSSLEEVPPPEEIHTVSMDAADVELAPAGTSPMESPMPSAAQEVEAAPETARRAARAHGPKRPDWPAAPQMRPPVNWGRGAAVGASIVVLFAAGWLVGSLQSGDSDPRASAVVAFLRNIGIAGARFQTMVSSRPEGARIAVDGKDTGLRTPANLELPPGEHRVDLSFPDLGSASYMVTGARGDKVSLEAPLWGSVDVIASDRETPVSVVVDGEPRGFAPTRLDSLAPGPHELRFTGPGMASWGTTVEVRVGETREVLAYPLQSPATGLLQVRAVINREGENQSLTGARVFVDGEARGVTPLTFELPRGPHSVRVAHQQEEVPVQVIDLPGGNQRFATFEFGLNLEYPKLVLRAPAQVPAEEPVLISATLTQVATGDVREMWLHVRTPENRWRRYPMTLLDAQGSAVGAAPFPAVLIGPEGTTRYYVSVLTSQGDEYFTELQTARKQKTPPTSR